jgi:hypothetical protein
MTCVWTGPNGFTSNDWIISGLAAGDYFLTAQTACGVSMNDVFTVSEPTWWSIDPQPTHPSCSEEPDGGFAPVVTGGTPEYGFQWIGPNGFTSMDPILNNVGAGLYQLIITDANGCTYESQYTLQSNDVFTFDLGSDLNLCLNEVTTVLGPVGNNLIYYWQDGSDNAQFVIDPNQWGVGAHTLNLSVVTTSGCFGSDQLNFVVNDCVNIEESALSDFVIYPNPAENNCFQLSQIPASATHCSVLDDTGRLVLQKELNSNENRINFDHLVSGIYKVILLNNKGVVLAHKNWIFNP